MADAEAPASPETASSSQAEAAMIEAAQTARAQGITDADEIRRRIRDASEASEDEADSPSQDG